jgi:tRNA dimethylallyltransferase
LTIPITLLIGCTGSGKGTVARRVARRLNAEIVSVDSMKVYRRMDVGTAKPGAAERAEVPHHLIDVVEPSESFSVAQFVELADQVIADIHARGRPVLCVGGTALYLKGLTHGLFEGPSADANVRADLRARALAEGTQRLHDELRRVDPEAADRIHPNDMRRIERALEIHALTGRPISDLQTQWRSASPRYACRWLGIRREREDQSRRINRRVVRMMEAGLPAEVRSLLAEPAPLSDQARQAVGYAEIIEHLQGGCSLEDAVEAIKINSRRLAKQQRTWFRRFEDVTWIDAAVDEPADELAERMLVVIRT